MKAVYIFVRGCQIDEKPILNSTKGIMSGGYKMFPKHGCSGCTTIIAISYIIIGTTTINTNMNEER